MIYSNNIDQIEKYYLYYMEEDINRRWRDIESADIETQFTREVNDE